MHAPCPEREGHLEELGLLLRLARQARGWTQRELADRIGCSLTAVRRWEATQYVGVRTETLMKVSEALCARVFVRIDMLRPARDVESEAVGRR
jgi:transcriptional regulator with XRE-family HTH domain